VIWNTQHQAVLLQQRGITHVTVNVSHPGAVATNFGQASNKGWLVNSIYKIALALSKHGPFHAMAAPERGAATNVYLATSPAVQGISGAFWGKSKQQQPATRYYSAADEQRVWDYCLRVVQPYL